MVTGLIRSFNSKEMKWPGKAGPRYSLSQKVKAPAGMTSRG